MKRVLTRRLVITLVVLLALGTALALLVRREQSVSLPVLLADVLFSQASVVVIYGLWLQLGNMHMFTSFTYSFKSLHRLVRGSQMRGTEMKEDFLAYRKSRPHHDEAGVILIFGAVLLVISIVMSMVV